MGEEFKPDYLKVTGKDRLAPAHNIPLIVKCHSESVVSKSIAGQGDGKPSPSDFGFFKEILGKENYFVLEFTPASMDLGFTESSTIYRTREEALNEAIVYLDKRGYWAKPFDLEGMIEKV